MKLDLGTTDALPPGYVGVDIVPNPAIPKGRFIRADLTKPWPFPDGSVTHIRAFDIFEHLPNKVHSLNESWRVLKHGGTVEVFVPTWDGVGACCDPQHCSYWSRHSFDYFCAGTPEWKRFHRHYGIKAKFKVLREKRGVYVRNYPSGPERIVHLTILLQAVKP